MKKHLKLTDKILIIFSVVLSIVLICAGVFYNEIYTQISSGADLVLWVSIILLGLIFIITFFRILYKSGSEEGFNGYIIIPTVITVICVLFAFIVMEPITSYRLDRQYENCKSDMIQCIDEYLITQDPNDKNIKLPEEYSSLSITGEVIQYEEGNFYFFITFKHARRIEGFAYMLADAPYQSVRQDYSNFDIKLLGNNFSYLTLYY